jgi:hypothetical protein
MTKSTLLWYNKKTIGGIFYAKEISTHTTI